MNNILIQSYKGICYLKKLTILSKAALNWSNVTVNTFIMLQMINTVIIKSKSPGKNLSWFQQKYWAVQLF